MHRLSRITASLAGASLFLLMGTAFHAQDTSLSQLPLLTSSNLTYLGSFALPMNDGSGTPQGDLSYGGQAMSVTPEGTLLLGGHTWYSTLCEVSIPGIGGTAAIRQRCTEVTEGKLSQADQGEMEYGGSLSYGGRLILSAYSYYDADANQVRSHFASETTLTKTGDVVGPVQVGTAGAGFVSGYMALIPAEWQTAFGGTALTGNCCIPIISRTSSGPAVSVFNPDDVGVVSPVPATQLLGYPLDRALAVNTAANTLFTRADQMGGVAFPSGTRSVLFIGRHGTGRPCYGEGAACADQSNAYKGEHAYPYVHQVWAYDANDLLKVKNGQAKPYDIKPYATWSLPEMNNTGSAAITAAAYEPATNRIYITAEYADKPRVHVYQVNGGSTSTPPPTPPTTTPATPPPTTPPPTAPPTTTPTTPPTAPPAEICGDRIDNDRDGQVDEGCATTSPAATRPGAPRDLSANERGSSVSLSWRAPGGAAVTGYLVEQRGSSGDWSTVSTPSGSRTQANVSNLHRGRYAFRVRAKNAAGTGSSSNEVSVTIGDRRR